MSTTTTTTPRRRGRLTAVIVAAALAGALSPLAGTQASPAQAAGDVCDLCSLGFDPTACEALGGWPYDSTLESPPPAVAGGGNPAPAQPAPAQPAPAQPAPAAPAPAPAAPQPAAPQTSTKSSGGATTTENTVATQGGAVVATVPTSPTLAYEVSGRTLSLAWTAPADGGAAITGYKLVLNGGTPIQIPGDATSYEIALGAGTYDAALIATNDVGDSAPSASVTGIEIAGASATATPKNVDASDAVAASDATGASPVTGVAVIGVLVLAAGGLLAWWWFRRRSRPVAAAPGADITPAE